MRAKCIQAVEAAINRPLKVGEAADIEARIIKAKKDIAVLDRKAFSQMTESERLVAASKKVGDDLQAEFAKKKQRIAIDILATQKNLDFVMNHPDLTPLHALNRMLAFYADGKGRIKSIDTDASVIAADYKSQILDLIDATRGKFLGILHDKTMVQDIVREMHGTDTGNATAKQAAKQFSEVSGSMRERFNRGGGSVGQLDDWGLPHSHSQFKILQAGRQEWLNTLSPKDKVIANAKNSNPNRNFSKPFWVRDTLANLNRDRYVREDGQLMDDVEVTELLNVAYDTLTTGGANKMEAGQFQGNSSRAKRGSEERVLHFKDGDAWLEYQSKYGEKDLLDTVTSHIDRAALDIALVERFGSNPNTMYKFLSDSAKKAELEKGDITESGIAKLQHSTDNLYNQVGRLNVPVSTTLGNWFKAYRGLNVAAKLGSTAIMTIGDQATIMRTAKVNELAYHSVFAQHLALINPANSEGRELARSLGLGIEEMLSSLNRWGDDGLADAATRAGKAAKWSQNAASSIMKISGTTANTAAGKQGFSMMMLDKYGRMTRDKEWSDLGGHDREWLERAGVSETDWNVWKLANVVEDGSKKMLTAHSIYQIPDTDILPVIAPEVATMRSDIQSQVDQLDVRNQKDQQWIAGRQARYTEALSDAQAKLAQFSSNKDVKGTQERQALQDRADLLQAHIERAQAQSDIDAYLLAEKQQNRIRDFLQQVEEGKHSDKAGAAADANIQQTSMQRGNIGESLGKRSGNAERRITEIQARIRQSERDQTKAVTSKTQELIDRLDKHSTDLSDFINRAGERQTKRQFVIDRLNNSIGQNEINLAKKAREQAAGNLMAHVFDEQGLAVIESGARERAKLYGGLTDGTVKGEVVKSMLQFKSFTAALMMRHGGRAKGQEGATGKAAYAIPLIVSSTLLGGLILQLQQLALGNDPKDMTAAKFWGNSLIKGGSLGVYGDIILNGGNPDGSGWLDMSVGPIGSDLKSFDGMTGGNVRQLLGGKKTNAGAEAIRFAKNHTPAANLWYTKAATDHIIFQQLQEIANPGYNERMAHRLAKQYDTTSWWGANNMLPEDSPDFGKAVGR